jgi:chromosome segregation protein
MSKEKYEESKRLANELSDLRIRSAEMQKENEMLKSSMMGLEASAKEKKETMSRTQKEVALDLKKKAELNKAREKIESEVKKSGASNKEAYEKLGAVNSELDVLNKDQGAANSSSEGVSRQIQEVMVKKGQMEVRVNDIVAELSTYGDAVIQAIDYDVEDMEKEVNLLTAKVSALGNVNLKAPEAYGEKSKSVEDANEKVNTLEGEKHAVLSMIEEIDSKKLSAFTTTFDTVNKNFGKLYNYIFPGTARIELENPETPLESGLDIKIEDGKNRRRLGSLSGGERSLISLVLIFSIHMCKPSALYLFDEIDSALDKENSKRLSQLIKEMSKEAQFIVVSHNDSLIVNTDAAIGVVKTEGESKVVGIEISSNSNK